MIYPSNLDLLEFFGIEPSIEGDVQIYELKDSSNIALVFSFNTTDDSVQTILKINERVIFLICHECLTQMWIEESTLRAKFERDDYQVSMLIKSSPSLQVEWSGIRTN